MPEDKRGTFGYGDVWTWTALDPDTRLIVSWLVSDRSMDSARDFMADLASRLVMRAQITTDANTSYREVMEAALWLGRGLRPAAQLGTAEPASALSSPLVHQ